MGVIAGVINVGSRLDPNNPTNPVPYALIFVIVGVVVAVIVVFILYRKGILKLTRVHPVYEG
ncbi:MAG: hypothetical protein RBG13Loki_1294, partial [Promethearchaeota archaeon CR_4]